MPYTCQTYLFRTQKLMQRCIWPRSFLGAMKIAAHQGVGSVTGQIMPRSCKSYSSLQRLFMSSSRICLGVVTEKGTAFSLRWILNISPFIEVTHLSKTLANSESSVSFDASAIVLLQARVRLEMLSDSGSWVGKHWGMICSTWHDDFLRIGSVPCIL